MSHKKEYEDQIALFALGLLSGYELREIEAHLEEGCEICEGLLKDNDIVFNSLSYSLEDSPVPDEIKKKIFEKLEAGERLRDDVATAGFWHNIRPIWLNLGTVLSAALIIFLVISNVSLRNKLSSQQEALNELLAKSGKETEMMQFFTNPKVDIVKLASIMTDTEASGKLMMNPDTHQALLLVSDIPPLTEGKTYQLWIIDNGNPVSMGTFEVDRDGNHMMEIKSMPEPTERSRFAVTLEPEGGMPHPTGDIYLLGSL